MTGNCGFPDGYVHSHSDRCYEAGRRDLVDALRAVIATPDDVQQWEPHTNAVREVEVVDVARLRALITTDTGSEPIA